jgi:hypothetical protein
MNRPNGIRTAVLALAAATALQAPAFAEDSWNPQEEARTEEWIQQVITGKVEAGRQEQARIDQLVRQALQAQRAVRPAEMAEATPAPLARTGSLGR